MAIHSSSSSVVASLTDKDNAARPNDTRPVTSFHPSPWGDYYLNFVEDDEITQTKKENEVKELETKVKKELQSLLTRPDENFAKLLNFVDAIERLGVGYRLEEEVEHAVRTINETRDTINIKEDLDLYHTSLLFRLVRQHGFYISCGVFDKFKSEKGMSFDESLASDIKGMLSLYEASFVGKHGDYTMDEARDFTTNHLKTIDSSHPLFAQVDRALYQPQHRGMPRLESRLFISFYEADPCHNTTLLKFAKLDFNMVQSLHKRELRDLTRWWKDLDLIRKMPFPSRDRLVEGYFWTLGPYYEPEYSLGRKLFLQVFKVTSIVDDIYDAYGTIDELTIFTRAVEKWDRSCMSELPEYMQLCYKALIDTFEEFERDLAPLGRSQYVKYAREEMIDMCRVYFQEAKWCHEKHKPTFDEYMNKASIVSFGYNLGTVVSYLGVKEANKEAFEWARQNPLFIRDAGIIGRLMDDVGSHEFEQGRNHVPSSVENYKRQYGVTEEVARKEFQRQIDFCWKDVNEMMMKPYIMPKPLLTRILNECRIVDVIYKGEDSYTFSNHTMKNNIAAILTDPISL